jgi:hypothetical protein
MFDSIETVCRKTLQHVNRDSGQNRSAQISVKNYMSAKITGDWLDGLVRVRD